MKYLRRFAVFAAKKLVLFTLGASLLIYAFYLCFNIANAYIIVSEGMEKRVDVCLTRDDYVSLNDYFTVEYLNNDPVLAAAVSEASPYYPFEIKSYDYDIKLSSLRWSPRKNCVTCTATEYVTAISGSVKAAYASSVSGSVPSWSSGRYIVTLQKTDGRWKISSLQQDYSYKDVES
ncbi:MAG: hypothetical protein IKR85_00200 [Clostridia bacterium]|nr:hypothetical protein [Clostridia bacterium]